ncbi:MAG: hypothetical protein OXG96_16725 [Acidobacteria bacterium]|nr:hypothetical protein [Acidobacteriota bacterium]
MKVRTTILGTCTLLLLVGAVVVPSELVAQGYAIDTDSGRVTVVSGGNNQLMPDIKFLYQASGSPHLSDQNVDSYTVQFNQLRITNDENAVGGRSASYPLRCDSNNDKTFAPAECSGGLSAEVTNTNGEGEVTITLGTTPMSFQLIGIRVDASRLDPKQEIRAYISATLGGTFSQRLPAHDWNARVGSAEAGLEVTAVKAVRLSCKPGDAGNNPNITVTEGFTGAWGDRIGGSGTEIRIALTGLRLPTGSRVNWSGKVTPQGELVYRRNRSEALSDDGSVAIFRYTPPTPSPSSPRSFKISPEIPNIEAASIDVTAQLWPTATRSTDGEKDARHLATRLSYDARPVRPEGGNGEGWLVVSKCVTYLLYPFVTCQTSVAPNWTTGISVSNTSRDAGVFGPFDESTDQSGAVTGYLFPKEGGAPISFTVTNNLPAGHSTSFTCSQPTYPTRGSEGYLIIKADFQHARGMGFVMGLERQGQVNATHGYIAEVIVDPSVRSGVIK